MRLIDADALEELFREVIGGIAKRPEINGNLEHMIRASAMVVEMIKDAPTIEPQPHWIPCSVRLPEDDPEDDGYVLISKKPSQISGNKFSVTIGVRYTNSRSHKTEWRDSGFGYLSDDKVLAWMPLLPPYQPKEEES